MQSNEKDALKEMIIKYMPPDIIRQVLEFHGGLVLLKPNLIREKSIENFSSIDSSLDTWHYIAIAPEMETAFLMPFNFVYGRFPEKRLNAYFPKTIMHFFPFSDAGICFVQEPFLSDSNEVESAQLNDGTKIHGNVLIFRNENPSSNDYQALTFKECLTVFSRIELSKSIRSIIVYPPC